MAASDQAVDEGPDEYDTMDVTQDVVRVYDVTDDGMLRVERVHRQHGPNSAVSTTRVGVVDIESIAAFPGDVPVIDLETCDDDMAAFAKELVA
jgi:hypothetical protein